MGRERESDSEREREREREGGSLMLKNSRKIIRRDRFN
jgi:hypothetical protein